MSENDLPKGIKSYNKLSEWSIFSYQSILLVLYNLIHSHAIKIKAVKEENNWYSIFKTQKTSIIVKRNKPYKSVDYLEHVILSIISENDKYSNLKKIISSTIDNFIGPSDVSFPERKFFIEICNRSKFLKLKTEKSHLDLITNYICDINKADSELLRKESKQSKEWFVFSEHSDITNLFFFSSIKTEIEKAFTKKEFNTG